MIIPGYSIEDIRAMESERDALRAEVATLKFELEEMTARHDAAIMQMNLARRTRDRLRDELAEMEKRLESMASILSASTRSPEQAAREMVAEVERLNHYIGQAAGRAVEDKITIGRLEAMERAAQKWDVWVNAPCGMMPGEDVKKMLFAILSGLGPDGCPVGEEEKS